MEETACTIDDFGPLPLLRPADVGELGELVRQAAAQGTAVYPLGGQTLSGLGHVPSRPGVGVDVRGLDRVIDYPARDMTVTVQAGVTLADLQALLARENQRLPVDVPRGERATLGGAIAANVSGPRRYGFGTLRDYVIGISVVGDSGREAKAGGRVVKNVAGYDLCKLHVGALGTLGVITQVTLKLRPTADERAVVILRAEANQVGPLLDLLHGSHTRPVCLDLLNGPGVRYINQHAGPVLPEAPWVILAGYEDNREAVGWQVQRLLHELPAEVSRGFEARVGTPADPLWRALVEFADQPGAALTFKANILPSAVAEFCTRAAELREDLWLQAHAGNGIVLGHVGEGLSPEEARALLDRLHKLTGAAGNAVVLRCPPAWKASLPVWGKPRADAWLMREVKRKLDPQNLFNPGRFVDGI